MKRLVLQKPSELIIDECDKPILNNSENEVIIRVNACGVCSSDYSRIFKNGAYFYPLVLGHEFVGTVIEKSKKSKFEIGQRVAVFPLLPCKVCENCQKNFFTQCIRYSYYGSRENGGLQEFIKIPDWNLLLIDNIPIDIAATIEPASVAYHAISLSELKFKNQKILIIGSGIISMYLGIMLKNFGYLNVTFMVRNNYKSELLIKYGFRVISSNESMSDYECVFECVGSNETIVKATTSLGAKGKLILIGNPSSDIHLNKQEYWNLLRKELVVKGVWNSTYVDDWKSVIDFMKTFDLSIIRDNISISYNLHELKDNIINKNNGRINKLKVMWINE